MDSIECPYFLIFSVCSTLRKLIIMFSFVHDSSVCKFVLKYHMMLMAGIHIFMYVHILLFCYTHTKILSQQIFLLHCLSMKPVVKTWRWFSLYLLLLCDRLLALTTINCNFTKWTKIGSVIIAFYLKRFLSKYIFGWKVFSFWKLICFVNQWAAPHYLMISM